ncbi:MAG: DUF3667 domain-containing protein [Flavobacteriaceae bacterium]|nr:DUF3667 domain-containing protein [Flavobacteriaceae bacterium]
MECKNCTKELSSNDDFCSICGAKVIRNRLTIKNLWADFTEQFLNYDNRFLQTYLNLFKKPEEVIGGYIHGTRKRYVNVISYYAIAITFAGFQLFIIRKFFPESMDLQTILPKDNPNAGMDLDWIYDYYSFLSLINLPIYAFIAKFTFIGLEKYNYTEHLVINTYLVAQYTISNFLIIIAGVAMGINFYIIGNILTLFLIFYTASVYKKLYPLSTAGILTRTLLFFGLLVALMILLGIIQFIFMYLNGDIDKIIEAAKAKKQVTYIASSFINWTS